METVNVLRTLGNGVFGTTFVVERSGTQFVCKIEKMPSASTYSTSESLWREVEFRRFAAQYPNHFMQLKSWGVMDDCKHIQVLPANISTDLRKQLSALKDSPLCSQLTYTPVLDNTLSEFYAVTKPGVTKDLCGMLCQCIYALSLMQKAGYSHGGMHNNNIMYANTTAKRIKLGTITVPTHGMQWYIIDYGHMMHKKYIENANKNRRNSDAIMLRNPHLVLAEFIMFSIRRRIWNAVNKYKLEYKPIYKIAPALRSAPEYQKIEKYIPNLKEASTLDWCTCILFLLHFPVEYHKHMGIDTARYASYIISYPREQCEFYANLIKRLGSSTSMIKYIADKHL